MVQAILSKIRAKLGIRSSNVLLRYVIGVMILTLITVAFLQYRWTTEAARATQLKIGGEVVGLMTDWHLALFREFSSVCVYLLVGPDAGAQDEWQDYQVRLDRWRKKSRYPELVSGVYIWESSNQKKPRLFVLQSGTNPPREVEPEASSEIILARLSARSSNLPVALSAWKLQPDGDVLTDLISRTASSTTNALAGWQFDQDRFALVHPIIHHPLPGDVIADVGERVDWIVVTLNPEALKRTVFPSIAREYLGSENETEYTIVLTSGGDVSHVLYSSEPQSTASILQDPDASMVVFGSVSETTEEHLGAALKNGASLGSLKWHDVLGPLWFPVIQYEAEQQPWKLLIDRHAGSPDDFVQRARSRNLVISAIVLLLLAASMALVVITSYREQSLAKAQLDFVASVSHELRTPLAVIGSAADNIADGVVEGKAQLERYGHMLREQTRQLSELVEQVLLFAAVKDGRDRYEITEVDVAHCLETAIGNTAYMLQRAGFTLDYRCEPGMPRVQADAAALTQCLQNLIVNAVKYSGDSRTINVTARLRRSSNASEKVEISVCDSGIGISDTDLQHIFEPFFRSSEVVKTQIAGTGLGLALARRIARVMGGDLKVQSELGKGSTFTVTLPVEGHANSIRFSDNISDNE